MQISAQNVYFIKLGEESAWEDDCIQNGTLRFGYSETPHEAALAGDWESVKSIWKGLRTTSGAASNDTRQIQIFYEATENDIFITFSKGRMFWCKVANSPPELLSDGTRRRKTLNGWHDKTANGTQLTKERLSGDLIKVQMYQGTICEVKARDYLLKKLNDQISTKIIETEKAMAALCTAVSELPKVLTPKDFELLVELIFARSGWQRTAKTGGVQKDVDLELLLPTTDERAFVQVKSKATDRDLRQSITFFREAGFYSRMFFVWHTGEVHRESDMPGNITLIGPHELPRLIMDAGLTSWLRDKAAGY